MSIQKLRKQHDIHPEFTDIHLIFGLDRKIKQFKFVGYQCNKCMAPLKNPTVLPKHHDKCNKKHRTEPIPDTIIDNKRQLWRSITLDTSNDENMPKTSI